MRVVVCGGRNYVNEEFLFDQLDRHLDEAEDLLLIEGGAKGADSMAREWAKLRGVKHETVKAEWKKHGKKAGYLRNKRMIIGMKADLVIAFFGGKGTAHSVAIAQENSIPVLQPRSMWD